MESDILVVDDSAAIRKILQRVLRQTGMAIHAIHEAGDGQEALALLAEHPVDLVLTARVPQGLPTVAQYPGCDDYHRRWRNQSRRSCQARSRWLRAQAVYSRSDQREAGRNPGGGVTVMNLNQIITDSIRTSAANVFSTMLGTELASANVVIEGPTPHLNEGVVSFIGMAGTWGGTGRLR